MSKQQNIAAFGSHRRKTKIFDPADGFAPFTNLSTLTDATIGRRGDRWCMFLAGKATDREGIQLFSATLPPNMPLAPSGWQLTAEPGDPTKIAMLAEQTISAPWDLKGGRHCPSYVRGWDPDRNQWVERIYYAGGAAQLWGPYTIGYLEWDGEKWVEQPSPVFTANEAWERGSVYEPNLIYSGGKWKMWYVAGSNQEDYIVQGYAESPDGRANWSRHQIVFPAEEKVFDFCVVEANNRFEAVFSRVSLAPATPPETCGLWWCHAKTPSPDMRDWSQPVQIMNAEPGGWHSGPWKPSFRYSETNPDSMLIFFDGVYKTDAGGPFPYVFTLGCLQIQRPDLSI
jgi:hypothetical protein